jgi:hypothetical protein
MTFQYLDSVATEKGKVVFKIKRTGQRDIVSLVNRYQVDE